LAPQADLDAAAIGPAALWPAILKAGALLLGLVAAALLLRHTGTGLLHALHPSWQGAAVLILAGGAMTAAGVPRQVLAFAGGYTFGAPLGGAIALAGQLLGCALDYTAAHGLASSLAQRLLARPITQRLHRVLAAHPFTATLTLRLMPVSSNVTLNLLAGASRLNPRAFFSATLLGYLPQTIIFALLGSGTQVGRGAQIAVGLALFIGAMALGLVLYRWTRLIPTTVE
jgi:uncharacterized membrane protein YdjX (TVP38/TMEM64 family)